MKFLSIDEWRALGIQALPPVIRCPVCYGAGEITPDDCFECDGAGEDDDGDECASCDGSGRDGEPEECERCESSGTVKRRALTKEELRHELSPRRFADCILVDAKLLAEWQSKPLEQVLAEAGFVPFTSIFVYCTKEGGRFMPSRIEPGKIDISLEGIQ